MVHHTFETVKNGVVLFDAFRRNPAHWRIEATQRSLRKWAILMPMYACCPDPIARIF